MVELYYGCTTLIVNRHQIYAQQPNKTFGVEMQPALTSNTLKFTFLCQGFYSFILCIVHY